MASPRLLFIRSATGSARARNSGRASSTQSALLRSFASIATSEILVASLSQRFAIPIESVRFFRSLSSRATEPTLAISLAFRAAACQLTPEPSSGGVGRKNAPWMFAKSCWSDSGLPSKPAAEARASGSNPWLIICSQRRRMSSGSGVEFELPFSSFMLISYGLRLGL